MDILDPLEKILDVALALKELVEIFKGKDKFFEKCSSELDSVVETVTKYKKERDPKKPLPIACKNLQQELDGFQEFLEKEKNRNSFTSFFRGSSMVNEAKEILAQIDAQLHKMNFAVIVESKGENTENFQKLLTMGGVGGSANNLKKKFANEEAFQFWVSRFYNEEQVSWVDFKPAIKTFALDSKKIELTDLQIEKILTCIDENSDRLIRCEEWDNFYETVWTKDKERDALLNSPPVLTKKISTVLPPLVLRVSKFNQDDPKQFRYPLKHEFVISEEKTEFVDLTNKQVSIFKNWDNEALIIGREKPGIYRPDIYFHYKATSIISQKQFQVNLKKTLNEVGFYINNLSTGCITGLVVEKIPYAVQPGMIFDLSDALIHVKDVEPLSKELDENDTEYFHVNVLPREPADDEKPTLKVSRRDKKKKEEEEEKKNQKKPRGRAQVPPSITFEILEGNHENKGELKFEGKKGEEKVVKIGSGVDNDLIINDIEKNHIVFRYDKTVKNWLVERDETCTNELEADGCLKTYLYLINAEDYSTKEGEKVKAGKVAAKLRDNMKIGFNYNELEVVMK